MPWWSPGDPSVGPAPRPTEALVACLGESLILLPGATNEGAGGHVPGDAVIGALAGAEANVAAGLAAMAVPVAWLGRLGADDFGDFLLGELRRRGVDVRAVQLDPNRPTGSYAKSTTADSGGELRSRMHYRRAGSAASAMTPAFLAERGVSDVLKRATLIHCSGITPALSRSCADLMRALLAPERPYPGQICFDVNWREQLWPSGDPKLVVELSGLADIVLVGGDEARRVFGTDDPRRLRAILPGPEWIILKDGSRGALGISVDGARVDQPALHVDVVEPVGAGDAFAAGYLAGVVHGDAPRRCLRRAHIAAAAVLTVIGDSAPMPAEGIVDVLLDCAPGVWAGTRVTADGFAVPSGPVAAWAHETGEHR